MTRQEIIEAQRGDLRWQATLQSQTKLHGSFHANITWPPRPPANPPQVS